MYHDCASILDSNAKGITLFPRFFAWCIQLNDFCTCIHSGVYLSLNDDIIPNHGYVMISDIGSTDNTALLCITNRDAPSGSSNSGGDWFAPDGVTVGVVASTTVPGFGRNKGDMVVRLRRNSVTEPEEGIYHCVVQDADDVPQTVYVGLYNSGGGNGKANTNILQLTLSP